MSKKVFLSYVHEDKGYADQIKDWARTGQLGDVEIVTETEDVRQEGAGAVMGHLRPKLREADAGIVLVGRDTHDRPWVDREVSYLRSNGKPVIPDRIRNTTGAPPPEVRGEPETRHSPHELREALDAALWRR